MINTMKIIDYNSALISFLLLIVITSIKAETAIDSVVKPIVYSIGITPTAIFNTATGYQINQRLTFKDRTVIGLESGYIFDFIAGEATNIHGIRLRPSLNYLIPLDPQTSVCIGGFVNYRKINFDFIRTEIRGGGNFTEKVRDKGVNRFVGVGVFFGARFIIKNIEITYGIGTGWGDYRTTVTDENGVIRSSIFDIWFANNENESFNIPIIFTNLGINYRFM